MAVLLHITLKNGEVFDLGHTPDLDYFINWDEALGEEHGITKNSNSRMSNATDARIAGLFIPAQTVDTVTTEVIVTKTGDEEAAEAVGSQPSEEAADTEEAADADVVGSTTTTTTTTTTSSHPSARLTPSLGGWTSSARNEYTMVPADQILKITIKEVA